MQLIRVDPLSLEEIAGDITGHIWFDVAGGFPEEGWSDFPVVVLTAWLNLLEGLAVGAKTGKLHFMDGPFVVLAALKDKGELHLELRSERRQPKSTSLTVDFLGALADAIASGRKLEMECAARGWRSTDIEHLRQALEAADNRRRT